MADPHVGRVDGATFATWVRRPAGTRPLVYRRYISYPLALGAGVATPILNQVDSVETLVVQVTSIAANPVFFGAQNVTNVNGTRINPGQALVVEEEQDRYEFEVVRSVQELTNVVATGLNVRLPVPPAQWPRRVVLNPNDFFVFVQVARAVNIFLFYPPEES